MPLCEHYIGEYKFGEVCISDGMPRLIDDEVFLAVQAKLDANKRGGKGAIQKIHPEAAIEDYWLTGKLCCGLCGGGIQGISGTSKSGKPYYYYSCQNHRKRACKLKNQRKELLETIVMYLLDDLLRDPALRMLIAEACYEYHMSLNNDSDAFEESIKAKLKDVENKLANLLKSLESGIFNSTTAERMNVLENEKSMLNDALIAEQNRKKYDLKLNDILRFLDGFIGDINNPDTRSHLLNGLIDKIYVYPDKLAISSFYSDDRRELPFDETKELIEGRRAIMSMMGDYIPAEASDAILEIPCGDLEVGPDFFPEVFVYWGFGRTICSEHFIAIQQNSKELT